MTNEELANHWNISLEEVADISNFMNTHFYLSIIKHPETELYYGVMYQIDYKNKNAHLIAASPQGFATLEEAAENWNSFCDNWKIPNLKSEIVNIPADACKVLRKINLPTFVSHKESIRSFCIDRESKERS